MGVALWFLVLIVASFAVTVVILQASEIAKLERRLTARRDQRAPWTILANFYDVGLFHEKFGLDSVTQRGAGPRGLPVDVIKFRHFFMREELDEFILAANAHDDAKAFDALIDLVYVAMGTAHLMGFPWQAGWDAVQRANMAKERAASAEDPRSKRGHALDVVKPENWTPPDIEGVLRRHGWPPV